MSEAWEHHDPIVRIKAVGNLEDQNLLAEVATKDDSKDVRYAAEKKIKDQKVILEICEIDDSRFVQQAAKNRLKELQKNNHKK